MGYVLWAFVGQCGTLAPIGTQLTILPHKQTSGIPPVSSYRGTTVLLHQPGGIWVILYYFTAMNFFEHIPTDSTVLPSFHEVLSIFQSDFIRLLSVILTKVVQQALAFVTNRATETGLGVPLPHTPAHSQGLAWAGWEEQHSLGKNVSTSPLATPHILSNLPRYSKGRGLGKHGKGLVWVLGGW